MNMDENHIDGGLHFNVMLNPEQYAEWQTFSDDEAETVKSKLRDYVKCWIDGHSYFKELNKE